MALRASGMGSCQDSYGGRWFLDYGRVEDGVDQTADFLWSWHTTDGLTASRALEVDLPFKEESNREHDSKKRKHVSSAAGTGNKACREKMRRDRLNDSFVELYSILDPGKPHKSDKLAILTDATCRLNQLRLEMQQLKESNGSLQGTIKILKAEKLELRDEKLRLKTEKDRIEQMLKGMSLPLPFIAQPAAATFHPAAFANCNKAIPCPNYPPIGMWHWIPPVALDTSQDHVLRSPVA